MGVLDNLTELGNANRQTVSVVPNWKPVKAEKKAKTRIKVHRKPKAERDAIAETRVFVFGRERGICRCCRRRRAESVHELRFRSLGGKVNKRNSVAVCGSLVGVEPSCHTYLQANQITYEPRDGANGTLYFTPTDQKRADWLRIKVGERIESAPMSHYEEM